MTSRRETVKTMAAFAAGLWTFDVGPLKSDVTRPASGPTVPLARIDRPGVQLYTVRSLMQKDVAGTLAAVAKLGYREVEFAGYFQKSPAEVRRMLDDNGLTSPSTHVGPPELRDTFDTTVEMARVIGHRYVTIAWLNARAYPTADHWKRQADEFNRFGEKAKAAGLRFAYHNHDFEFAPVEGQLPMEILLGGTDPSLVAFEMDLYWASKAGHDPRNWFARFPGRFEMVHVKDGRPNGMAMTEVGNGTIDWKGIFARRKEAGIRHYFVEHDNPADPLDSIRQSVNYLKALEF